MSPRRSTTLASTPGQRPSPSPYEAHPQEYHRDVRGMQDKSTSLLSAVPPVVNLAFPALEEDRYCRTYGLNMNELGGWQTNRLEGLPHFFMRVDCSLVSKQMLQISS